MSTVTLYQPDGTKIRFVNVHSLNNCAGRPCVVHNQTKHHMSQWKMHWRGDLGLMERLCPKHSIGHPDPDSLAYFVGIGDESQGNHSCCGCCSGITFN